MPVIKNTNDLVSILEPKIQSALEATQEKIYDTILKHIKIYYMEKAFRGKSSNKPAVYERTERFLNSLIKTELVTTGGKISCKVKIDDSYLTYRYPGNPNWKDNVPATGQDIATWANDGKHEHTHGYTVAGRSSFWDDAIKELGGKQGIYCLMVKNLKKAGVPLE